MPTRSREPLIEALWSRVSDPRWLGRALIVAGLFGVLSGLDASRAMAPAERFAGALAAAAAVAVAVQAGLGAHARRSAVRHWWSAFTPHEPGGRRALLTVLGVWLVVVVPLAALVAGAIPARAVGGVEIPEGAKAESFLADSPEAGLPVSLGASLRVERVDPTSRTAELRAGFADGRLGETHAVALGERIRMGEHWLTLDALRAQPELGRVTVQAVNGEGEASALSLSMNAPFELPDGSRVELTDASGNYLGQLGPAVRITVRDASGAELRRAWIFADAEAFDTRHAAGWTFALTEMQPRWTASFRVWSGPTGALPVPVATAGWAALVLLWLLASRQRGLRWSAGEEAA